ncbi:MAG: response regulator transcription factor [Thiogranum sp.]|nr:response regulator transcription factor [Thiogranum sp.]
MTAKTAATVLIVDDHPLVRAGLRQLIADEPDLVVCGEAASVQEAIKLLDSCTPAVAIVDISLADGSGLELIRRMHARAPGIRILVASMHDESLFAERALRAGATGYINKQEAAAKVIEALRQVLRGKIYLSQKMTEVLLRNATGVRERQTTSSIESLSNRELEVFELIGRGLSTCKIAEKLHLSIKTIETHRANIKKKLGLGNGNELALKAMQWTLEQQ